MTKDGDIVFISTPKGPSIFREFASVKNVKQIELWVEKLDVKYVDETPVENHHFEADLSAYCRGENVGIVPLKNVNLLHFSEPEEWLSVSVEPRSDCEMDYAEFRMFLAQKIAHIFRVSRSELGAE